jgi:hypothetical protein
LELPSWIIVDHCICLADLRRSANAARSEMVHATIQRITIHQVTNNSISDIQVKVACVSTTKYTID